MDTLAFMAKTYFSCHPLGCQRNSDLNPVRLIRASVTKPERRDVDQNPVHHTRAFGATRLCGRGHLSLVIGGQGREHFVYCVDANDLSRFTCSDLLLTVVPSVLCPNHQVEGPPHHAVVVVGPPHHAVDVDVAVLEVDNHVNRFLALCLFKLKSLSFCNKKHVNSSTSSASELFPWLFFLILSKKPPQLF